jgi:hypothetical protein
MKKMMLLLCSAFLLLSVVGVVNATTIDYISQLDSKGILTTTFSDAIVEDFNGGAITWDGSGSAQVVTGSLPGKYAAPYNSSLMTLVDAFSNPYLSIPNPDQNGSYSFKFLTDYTYFGLFWGSVDTYNSIAFYKDGQQKEIYSGGVLPPPTVANGNQSSDTSNLYVNFYDINSGLGFDEVVLSSNGYAFEVDNLAVGAPVPEPATMILLGTGLLSLAGFKRRKN